MKKNNNYKVSVDDQKCVRCGACVNVCSEDILKFEGDHVKAFPSNECEVCGHCIAVCKQEAIEHSLLPLNEFLKVTKNNQPNLEQIISFFSERRSIRNYLSKPIDRSIIEKLIGISRYVPSSQNKQAVDWLVLDKKNDISYFSKKTTEVLFRLSKIIKNPVYIPFIKMALGNKKYEEIEQSSKKFSDLYKKSADGEDPIFYNAPVVLLAYTTSGNYFGRDDSIYTMYNIMLAAHNMGLGSCQIGYFIAALNNNAGLRKKLKLPFGCKPQTAMILGYPKYPFYYKPPKRMPYIQWGIPKRQ